MTQSRGHGRPPSAVIALGMLVAALAIGCERVSEEPPENGEMARARAVSDSAAVLLKTTLSGELKAAIAAGGPASALHICAGRAQIVADSLSRALGVTVRRVSERYRNPANRPTEVESAVLARFAARTAPSDTIFTVGDRKILAYHYMRPITIDRPLCLNCHGDPAEMRPEVVAALRRIYPDDRAFGYRVGDLRGAFSVLVPVTGEETEEP